MEGRLIVARIAQTFRITPVGPPPEPVGKVTPHARAPIRLRLRLRQTRRENNRDRHPSLCETPLDDAGSDG